MSSDDLITFLNQFNRAMLDPTAPLPTLWPSGAFGVFLVFATQIGAGIPIGVVMARDAGLSPAIMALLYLASDVVLTVVTEPMLLALRWLSPRVAFIAALGNRLSRLSGAAGLSQGRVKGPLGLILFSFVFAPAPARAASEAAGHGVISGWTLAIIGDMIYFGVIAASTLAVISIFGDSNRLAIAPIIVLAWLLPMAVQRLRREPTASPREGSALRVAPATAIPSEDTSPMRFARKSTLGHNGRRRRAPRGLHR
jgi:hypothetical protein